MSNDKSDATYSGEPETVYPAPEQPEQPAQPEQPIEPEQPEQPAQAPDPDPVPDAPVDGNG